MKKATIITAVLLVISIFTAVGLGVGLGAQGIKSLVQNAEIQKSFSEIKDWALGNDADTDAEENKDMNDTESENNAPREVLSSGTVVEPNSEKYVHKAERNIALPMDNITNVVVNADIGDVQVYASDKKKPYMKLLCFSGDVNVNERNGYNFEVARIGTTLEINLKPEGNKKENNKSMIATLTLPTELTGVNLKVNAKVGNVSVNDIRPQGLTLNLNVGSATLTNVVSNVFKATLDVGNLVIGMGSRILESIDVNVKLGDFELYFPEDLGFTLDLDKAADIAGNIAEQFTKAFKTLVDGSLQYKDGKVKLNVDIGVGNFKMSPDGAKTLG